MMINIKKIDTVFINWKKIHFCIDDSDKRQIEDEEKIAANTSGLNVFFFPMKSDSEDEDGDFEETADTLGESQSVHPFQ